MSKQWDEIKKSIPWYYRLWAKITTDIEILIYRIKERLSK